MILLVLILLVILLFFVKYFTWTVDQCDKDFDRIPGPKGLPFIGNIEDLFCSSEERWRRLRERAKTFYPLYKMKVFNKRMVHLVDPSDIEVILSNTKYMSKGEVYQVSKFWLGNGILLAGGDYWRRSRKLLTKSFHFGALPNYIQTFTEKVANLNSYLEAQDGKPIKLCSFVNLLTFEIVCATLCGTSGLGKKTGESFLEALETLTRLVSYRMTIPLVDTLYKFTYLKKQEGDALKVYNKLTSHLLDKNDASLEDMEQSKLIKILLQNFDFEGAQGELNTFMFAGQDSTSTALIFFLSILANKPHFQDEILKEMKETLSDEPTYGEINQMSFLDRFIKECFRTYPPVHFIARTLSEDAPLPSGYTIPAGTTIFIDIYDIHQNSKIFPQPEIFDPDRFLPDEVRKRHPYSFIPFSAGPRNCIAQKYALLEIKTAICGILKKFKLEPVGKLEDIIFVTDLLLQSKHPLKVKFIPRSS